MKHAYIAPINYLHLVPKESKTHLLLVHLLSNKQYVDFYKARQKDGDFIILDNSAFEFKKPASGEYILNAVEKSGIIPDVIVAPDYPFEKSVVTIKSTIEFINQYSKQFPPSVKFLSVPQSKKGEVDDWISCYRELSDITDWIGMSILGIPNAFCSITQTEDISFNRVFATIYLKQCGIINPKILHHYLGLGDSIREILIQKELGVAYSNDSSSAFWHGIHSTRFDDSAGGLQKGKIRKEVDFSYPFVESTADSINYNIQYIENFITNK